MKDIWTLTKLYYKRHRSKFRYAIDAIELLLVVYGSIFVWGVIAELSGQSPESLIWPGLLTTIFCVYVIGRSHNVRRSRRIKKLYDEVQAQESGTSSKKNSGN